MMSHGLRPAPRAHGAALGRARLRVEPQDFQVVEQTGITPEGEGEHLWLRVRKTGCNTAWVAEQLARHYARPRVDVGYAGRKDRHAVCEQWFSVRLPGIESPAPPALADVEWLQAVRHRRKLAVGALQGNAFRLRLRGIQAARETVEARLAVLAARGVPNYFGAQRFGRQGANLERARRLLIAGARVGGRDQRELALSAARALAFNRVLALRVERECWDRLLPGELAMLAGTRSVFLVAAPEPPLESRLAEGDIHPTGPLPGRDAGIAPDTECAALEAGALAELAPLVAGLERAGVRAQRRALRLAVQDLQWAWEGDTLELAFALPAGAYATAVLHELFDCEDAQAGEGAPWC